VLLRLPTLAQGLERNVCEKLGLCSVMYQSQAHKQLRRTRLSQVSRLLLAEPLGTFFTDLLADVSDVGTIKSLCQRWQYQQH